MTPINWRLSMKRKVETRGAPKKVATYQVNGIRLPVTIKPILETLAENDFRSVNGICSMIIQKWLRSEGYIQ